MQLSWASSLTEERKRKQISMTVTFSMPPVPVSGFQKSSFDGRGVIEINKIVKSG